MSGLKSESAAKTASPEPSHPVWDEWIEICSFKGNRKLKKSHPVWDEWIEINK